MKFKINHSSDADINAMLPPLTVLIGESLPHYDFQIPENQVEDFDNIGLYELMEGVFGVRDDVLEDTVRKFLLSKGYEEEI